LCLLDEKKKRKLQPNIMGKKKKLSRDYRNTKKAKGVE